MSWKFEGGNPVYMQIMDHIRRAVLMGAYPPGSRFPAVRDIAAEANVNPNTMQRALMTLEVEGVLISRGTIGRFVTNDEGTLDKIRQELIRRAVSKSAAEFRSLGLTMSQAAAFLLALEKEES